MNTESTTTKALVANIKQHYRQLKKDKLAIQKDMVQLRNTHSWTQPDIAAETGIPQQTVSNWLRAYDEATNLGKPSRLTPESDQAQSDLAVAKRVLAKAPLEQVEQIIAGLTKSRQQGVAAAAGHEYLKARQDYDEHEKSLTTAEKRDRERATEKIAQPVRQAVAGFTTLGIVGHLDQAREELNGLVADSALTPKAANQIGRALKSLVADYEFACQMAGIESRQTT